MVVIRACGLPHVPWQAEADLCNPLVQNKFMRVAVTGGVGIGSLTTGAKG